jgi:hypothetical protein
MFRIIRGWIVIVALLVSVLGGVASVEAELDPACMGGELGVVRQARVRPFLGGIEVHGSFTDLYGGNLGVLPGVGYTPPSGTADTAIVTFSAACRLIGASGPSNGYGRGGGL